MGKRIVAKFDDLYAVLGVRQDADDVVITAAYKSLVKKYHPDTSGSHNPKNAQMFRLVQNAYDKLRDKEQRHRYDQSLAESAKKKATKQTAASGTSSDNTTSNERTGKGSYKAKQNSKTKIYPNSPKGRWTGNSYVTATLSCALVLLIIIGINLWTHKGSTIDLPLANKPIGKNSLDAMSTVITPNLAPMKTDSQRKFSTNDTNVKLPDFDKLNGLEVKERDLTGGFAYPKVADEYMPYPGIDKIGTTEGTPLPLPPEAMSTVIRPNLAPMKTDSQRKFSTDDTNVKLPDFDKLNGLEVKERGCKGDFAYPLVDNKDTPYPGIDRIGKSNIGDLSTEGNITIIPYASPPTTIEQAVNSGVDEPFLKHDSLIPKPRLKPVEILLMAASHMDSDRRMYQIIEPQDKSGIETFRPTASPVFSLTSANNTALYLLDLAIRFLRENEDSDNWGVIKLGKSKLQKSIIDKNTNDIVWYSYLLRNALEHNKAYREFFSGTGITGMKTSPVQVEILPVLGVGRKTNIDRIVGDREILGGQIVP